MDSEIPIFRPRYPLRVRLVILGLPALFFIMICGAATTMIHLPFLFWLLALIIGIFASFIPFFIIREIRFLDKMVVRRHFLPDQFFSHKEVEQIEADSIRANGQRIRMGGIANLEELKDMSKRWTAVKLLKEKQHNRLSKESPYLQRGYGMYASFWGLMFGVIFMLMAPPWLPVNPRWLLAGMFLVVYMVYIYVVPRYL